MSASLFESAELTGPGEVSAAKAGEMAGGEELGARLAPELASAPFFSFPVLGLPVALPPF
jgi:hypothetical protein